MNNELLDIIRTANREFQEFIDQVSQKRRESGGDPGAMRRLEKVDLRLKHVSKCLAAVSKPSMESPEAAYQVLKYRRKPEDAENIMETLQFSLLAEKARLENVRTNAGRLRLGRIRARNLLSGDAAGSRPFCGPRMVC